MQSAASIADGTRADILVVDDRSDKRLVYQTILEELGQPLFMAESGEQALKRVLERDFAAITRELVRLCVPAVGDVCALTLVVDVPENTPMELLFPDLVGQRPDPGLSGRMVSVAAKPWLSGAIERVQQTGKAEVFASLHSSSSAKEAATSDTLEHGADPIESVAVIPLVARSRTIGVLTLGLRTGGRTFDTDTLSMATELAGRAAIALDNAQPYEKIQEQDRPKDEFLDMLPHEPRNALAASM